MPQKKRKPKVSGESAIGSKKMNYPNGLSPVQKVLMGKGMLVNVARPKDKVAA